MARGLVGEGEFIEIFVDTPLEVAEKRDVKGLYQKARQGQLKNFTGIDSPYERPANASLVLRTATLSPDESAARVLELLRSRGVLAGA
jgi:bifunctional enzyme CysN/CysC